MKKGDKRGSHVGMMLSFVVFVIFLIFLYTIIEPTTRKDKQYLLDYLKTELKKNLSADLTSISVSINEEIREECVNLKALLEKTEFENPIVIKDSKGILEHEISEKDLLIEEPNDNFFKIYYSEKFQEQEENLENCQVINDYAIGLIKTERYIFEEKIFELINKYKEDYDNLKKEFKIPDENDFSFSFTDSAEMITETEGKNAPSSQSVYAEQFLIQYFDGEANILTGSLKTKIW